MRATLAAYVMAGSVLTLAGLAVGGQFSVDAVGTALVLLPFALVGFAVSSPAHRLLDRAWTRPPYWSSPAPAPRPSSCRPPRPDLAQAGGCVATGTREAQNVLREVGVGEKAALCLSPLANSVALSTDKKPSLSPEPMMTPPLSSFSKCSSMPPGRACALPSER